MSRESSERKLIEQLLCILSPPSMMKRWAHMTRSSSKVKLMEHCWNKAAPLPLDLLVYHIVIKKKFYFMLEDGLKQRSPPSSTLITISNL